eukprot:EG_transcript_12069
MIPRLLWQRAVGAPGRFRGHCDEWAEVQLAVSDRRQLWTPYKVAVSSLDVDLAEERYLLAGGLDGQVTCYDLCNRLPPGPEGGRKPVLQYTPHAFNVSSVLWYPRDTGMFLTGSYDCTILLHNPNRSFPVYKVDFDDKVYHMAMAPTAVSHVLVAAATGEADVQLLDLRTATVTHHLFGHTVPVWAVTWSPANQFFLVSGACDGSIRMWDVRRSGCLGTLDPTQAASPEPPGAAPQRRKAHSAAVTSVIFTRDGRHIVSAGQDGVLRMWDTLDGAALVDVPFELFKGSARFGSSQMSVSGSDRFLYVPSDRNVLVYSLQDGRVVATLEGHFDAVHTTACHPGQRLLVSGGGDGTILVWDAETPDVGHTAAAEPNVDCWSDDEG